jgi:hypothetical protein
MKVVVGFTRVRGYEPCSGPSSSPSRRCPGSLSSSPSSSSSMAWWACRWGRVQASSPDPGGIGGRLGCVSGVRLHSVYLLLSTFLCSSFHTFLAQLLIKSRSVSLRWSAASVVVLHRFDAYPDPIFI